MGFAYGLDLRKRVISAIEGGMSRRKAAEHFAVAPSTAIKWHRVFCDQGSLEAAKQGQPGHSKLDPHEAVILAMIDERKDIALHEIAGRLLDEYGVTVVPSTIHQFLAKRGITFKKRQAMQVNSKGQMCLNAG